MTAFREEIVGHRPQSVIDSDRGTLWFAQYYLIAAAKDLQFIDVEPKFLGKADGLTISRLEHPSGSHDLKYTRYVYTLSRSTPRT
jgi:hypothetical protein